MAIQVRIASPCTEKWEGMQGDERVRFCARCSLNVFNIKELTEPEVRALFMKADGRVCGRVFQRRDGAVLTRDCPTGLAKLRKKALAGFTLAVSLLLAVVGFRFGSARSCPTDQSQGWFARVIESRIIDARETLRETRTFGPIIEELFPAPMTMTAGAMIAMPPTPPPPAPAP